MQTMWGKRSERASGGAKGETRSNLRTEEFCVG